MSPREYGECTAKRKQRKFAETHDFNFYVECQFLTERNHELLNKQERILTIIEKSRDDDVAISYIRTSTELNF